MNHSFTINKQKFKTFAKHTRQNGRKSYNTYIDVKVQRGSKWLSIFRCNRYNFHENQILGGTYDSLEVKPGFEVLRRVMGETTGPDLILEILDKVAEVYNSRFIQLKSTYGIAKMKGCLDGVDADSLMELIYAVDHGLSYLNLKGYFPMVESSGKILTEREMRNYYKKLLDLSITKILDEEPITGLRKRYKNMSVKSMIKSIFVPGHTLTQLQCNDLKIVLDSLKWFRFSQPKFNVRFWMKMLRRVH